MAISLTSYARSYKPFEIACLIIGATEAEVIPCSLQYLDCNQTESCFCPLLELHPQQQRTIFSLVTIVALFTMCSQLAEDFLDTLASVNLTPQ